MATDSDDDPLVTSEYISKPAPKSLRVVCYGSSSSKTPEKYLMEARALGFILALRGHVCVNGAGSFGCMAAMNAGAASGNGHIVGVIHEMWVVDGSDWSANVVDAGAHDVFTNPADRDGPIRELLVAGGDDLQERKKLLVKDADALIVLPGGPGTWDEVRTKPCRRILMCDFCSLESQTRVFVFSCGKWLVLDRLVFRIFQLYVSMQMDIMKAFVKCWIERTRTN